ncbi:MAG: PAS domain S-box protein [Methylococcales bacterium]|nr:PAS domain S-box protein [Methylococcales bacterium]
MTNQSTGERDIDQLRNDAEQLLAQRQETCQEKREALFCRADSDFAKMSAAELEKLLFEFQVHQIELELQNEELKRAHHELGDSHDDFARIYDLSPAAYLTLDGNGTILKFNRAAGQLLDGAKQQLDNKKLGRFIHPSDQNDFHFFLYDLAIGKNPKPLNVKLAANNHSSHIECHGFSLYGCKRSLCIHNNPYTFVELRGIANYPDGNGVQIYLSVTDVTDYKSSNETIACLNGKLEQKILDQTTSLIEINLDLTRNLAELQHSKRELREREAKLNAIFNATIEGIITIDSSGTMLSVNQAVTGIFGYCEEELCGRPFKKLLSPAQNWHGKEALPNWQANNPLLTQEIHELEGRRKDGSIVPLDVSLVIFSLDDVSFYAAIVRDVTMRKNKEQLEKAHLEELAHVARVCLVGELGSGIAHELSQPLSAIANYTQACLRFIDAENPDFEKLGDTLFKAHQQALRAGQVVRRMKEFVSPKWTDRLSTNINALVRDTLGLCASDFKQHHIALKLKLAENLPATAVDNVQIEQVLINLYRNSVDALKDLPENIPRQLSVETQLNKNGQLEIRVKDNGVGMDLAQQQYVLTPFFTTKLDGMGMGLAISRAIVEAHEGGLRFCSKPEKGTTFYVTLPIKEEQHDH